MPAKRGCSRSNTRALARRAARFIESLPRGPGGIPSDDGVRGHNRHPVHDRLRHEHPVERGAMKMWKARVVQRRLLVDWESQNAVGIALRRYIKVRRLAER